MLEAAETGSKVSKASFKQAVPGLRVDLINAQYELLSADFPMVVWIAGDDRIAANQVVNRLNEWMDARYIDTRVFAELSQEEAERPQLWRLWQAMPAKGRAAIMAGGMMRMVDMLLAGEIDAGTFNRWLSHLAALQQELVADGVLVLKFFLHTPPEKQRAQLRRAERDSEPGWWVDKRDWVALDRLGPAIPLLEKLIRATSAPEIPWTVVEATDPRYRDLAVARTIRDALVTRLGRLSLRQPKPSDGSIADSAVGANSGSDTNTLGQVDVDSKLTDVSYREKLAIYQRRLHRLALQARQQGVSTVLAFEGWDAAGKGGVIRRITGALEAGDYQVIPIAAPSEEERKYPYLWRFWRALPQAGRIVIFDRTWYGRVLVERVEGFAAPPEWQRAYEEINDFEAQLVEQGYYVAKFWLHISPEEQLARFKAREETPYKKYKITQEDYRNRERWNDYVEAVDQMVSRTTSDQAKWHVIAANDKRYARIEVLKALTKGLARTLKAGSTDG